MNANERTYTYKISRFNNSNLNKTDKYSNSTLDKIQENISNVNTNLDTQV